VHSLALKLGLVLAAENSKTPFYIAGGVLVAWALFISVGVGMRKPSFPETLGQQRTVMAVSVVLVAVAISMAVVTAGGSKSSAAAATPAASTGGAVSAVALEANAGGQLSYNATKLSAKAGKVTIEMANMSPVEHNVTVAQGSNVLGATPTFKGAKKSLTLTLAAGSYTFYCSVPGHRQAGMEGVLTVTS
jgi:plastocyanin